MSELSQFERLRYPWLFWGNAVLAVVLGVGIAVCVVMQFVARIMYAECFRKCIFQDGAFLCDGATQLQGNCLIPAWYNWISAMIGWPTIVVGALVICSQLVAAVLENRNAQ